VRAASESLASGRAAWFGIEGDVVEVRASRAGDTILVWLDSSRGSLASRLRPNLEDALHSAGIGFWEYDVDNDQMLWDAQCFCAVWSRSVARPPNRAELVTHVHPEDHDRVVRAFREAAARTGAHGIVFRVVLPKRMDAPHRFACRTRAAAGSACPSSRRSGLRRHGLA